MHSPIARLSRLWTAWRAGELLWTFTHLPFDGTPAARHAAQGSTTET